MTLSPESFKDVFARLASSVAVVTFDIDGRLHGFTATSLTPVSADPPITLFCVGKGNQSHAYLEVGTAVGISILSNEQVDMSAQFAGKVEPGGYSHVATLRTPSGNAVLEDAVAIVEGTITDLIPAGDHTIYLCRLIGGRVGLDSTPLLYYRRAYHQVGPAMPPEADEAGSKARVAAT